MSAVGVQASETLCLNGIICMWTNLQKPLMYPQWYVGNKMQLKTMGKIVQAPEERLYL